MHHGNSRPATRFPLLVVGICFAINMLDGFDVLTMAFTAPSIAAEWSIGPERLGVVFSAGLVGMALGAMLLGPLADRIGRRRMVLGSLLLIGVAMAATAFTRTVPQLVAWRVATGLGVGAMLASLTALVAEYSPEHRRNLMIALLHAAYPVGATLGGFLAAHLIEVHGWPAVFLAGGIASAVLLPVVALVLPESVDFLVAARPADALRRVNRILPRLGRPALQALPPAEHAAATGVPALFAPAYRLWTLLLWMAFFCSMVSVYFLLSWIPKIVVDAGLPIQRAIYVGVTLNAGGVLGMLVLGYVSAHGRLREMIIGFMLAGAAGMAAFGSLPTRVGILLAAAFIIGFLILGGFVALYTVAARLYPTAARVSGVGWGIGVGRFGAIVGPLLGGFIIARGWPPSLYFVILASPLILSALAIALLRASQLNLAKEEPQP